MTVEQLAHKYEKENKGYVCYAMYELTDQWYSVCSVYKVQSNGVVAYQTVCDGGTVINIQTGQADTLLDHDDLMDYLSQAIDDEEQPIVINRQVYDWVKKNLE